MEDTTHESKRLSTASSTFLGKHKKIEKRQSKHPSDEDDDSFCDEKEEVERKVRALQRIVPGGESLGLDRLFEETAGYIMALQTQIKAMRTLAELFQGLDKEKRKFGG